MDLSFLPMGAPSTPTQLEISWKPPETHQYIVNFNGAEFDKDNSVGLDVVIRNDEGFVMASLSQLVPLPTMVIEVETLAAC